MSDVDDHPRRRRSVSPRSNHGRSRSRSRSPYRKREYRGRSPAARGGGGFRGGNTGADKPFRLIVANLPFNCSWSDLKDFFKQGVVHF